MPGRDRSDLRTAEEASAGQWVIVPAFSIRVALRRGNRAPLPRPAVPASPENNYQCRSRVVQVFPSTGSLVRLAGAVMCEQDEIWQESRYFSEARMNELYDEGCRRGIEGRVDWAQLEAEARKMIESGLELADRVETA